MRNLKSIASCGGPRYLLDMLRAGTIALACGLAWATSAGAAPIPREEFLWRAALGGDVTNGGLYRVRVPGDVSDGSRAFPSDVRVLDEVGAEWPFFVWKPEGRRSGGGFRVEPFPPLEFEQPARHVRQEFSVLPRRGDDALHSRVVITTAGRDFVRRAELLGSEDRTNWILLADGYLLDQPRDIRLSNRVLEYGATNLPFLQVRIYPSARNGREALQVQSVEVLPEAAEESRAALVSPRPIDVPPEDLKVGVQTIEYDLGHRNLPVVRLRIEAADSDFARPLKVFGRNSETNAWRWVADGGIHRMGDQVRTAVDVGHATYRFLKVELYHYEQAPLAVTNILAEVEPVFLVLEAASARRAHVYFGCSTFSLPRYDLQRRVTDEEILAAPMLELERRQRNPSRLAHNLGAYGRWLGAMALGVLGILVVIVLVNWVRRRFA